MRQCAILYEYQIVEAGPILNDGKKFLLEHLQVIGAVYVPIEEKRILGHLIAG